MSAKAGDGDPIGVADQLVLPAGHTQESLAKLREQAKAALIAAVAAHDAAPEFSFEVDGGSRVDLVATPTVP